jgi:rhodanese-related sulfurtransferase
MGIPGLFKRLFWTLFGRLAAKPGSDDLEPRAALELIANGAGGEVVVLDVRTPKENAAARLEGAVNLDFYADDFKDKVAALDKRKTFVVHCAMGGRSAKAVTIMKELGFPRAYNLQGGIERWRKEGLPVKE